MGGPSRYYVYVLVDPRDQSIFYVGKGKGDRSSAHYRQWRNGKVQNAAKFERIGAISASGMKPESIIVLDGLTEDEAYAEEKRIIGEIGILNLTNAVPGQVTEAQKLVAWAKDREPLIKPFDEWLSERARSDCDISIYHRLAAEIRSIAGVPAS